MVTPRIGKPRQVHAWRGFALVADATAIREVDERPWEPAAVSIAPAQVSEYDTLLVSAAAATSTSRGQKEALQR